MNFDILALLRSRFGFHLGGHSLPSRGPTRLDRLLWLRRFDSAFARLFGFTAAAGRRAGAHLAALLVRGLHYVLHGVDVVLEGLKNLCV